MPFPRSGRPAVRTLSAAAMSSLLLTSAMKHFRDPAFFRQVVPGYLCREDRTVAEAHDGGHSPASDISPAIRPRPLAVMTREEWIAVSGLLELGAAVGILVPATRRGTATVLTAMFTVFLAGHIDALRGAYGPHGTSVGRTVHSVRLPLQVPLIWWAWSLRSTRREARK